ncbi:hypothetical protein [Paracoccus aerius]|uniref:Uncharacterized protein n=1 Tax=Paracoccus aerius TaxID=1915382 RepID=A0ABS1S966_9RHOB|nr:hypothetical protein [Paracoccus aerius]MBL3675090.1 hypothetical protein [Paracoccus aerius]GHG30877.1 hypothetical protein GCM10017322_32230 [Paracoccus aerius]
MIWMARVLAGPILWGALFSGIYGLHGLGCGLDWPNRETPLGALHPLAMIGAWLLGLALHAALIRWNRALGDARQAMLVRAGNWIGAVASAATLFPVIATSTCG